VGNPDRHDGKASPPSLGLALTSKPLKPSLPVASTNKHRIWESDSDDEEASPPSLDLALTSKPSKPSLPIVSKDSTVNEVMRDTNFDDILNKITAGLVMAGAVTFQEKLSKCSYGLVLTMITLKLQIFTVHVIRHCGHALGKRAKKYRQL